MSRSVTDHFYKYANLSTLDFVLQKILPSSGLSWMSSLCMIVLASSTFNSHLLVFKINTRDVFSLLMILPPWTL